MRSNDHRRAAPVARHDLQVGAGAFAAHDAEREIDEEPSRARVIQHRAEDGEEDGAPIYFSPNISYYTR